MLSRCCKQKIFLFVRNTFRYFGYLSNSATTEAALDLELIEFSHLVIERVIREYVLCCRLQAGVRGSLFHIFVPPEGLHIIACDCSLSTNTRQVNRMLLTGAVVISYWKAAVGSEIHSGRFAGYHFLQPRYLQQRRDETCFTGN